MLSHQERLVGEEKTMQIRKRYRLRSSCDCHDEGVEFGPQLVKNITDQIRIRDRLSNGSELICKTPHLLEVIIAT